MAQNHHDRVTDRDEEASIESVNFFGGFET
jgi:hypothetical protein